MKRIVLFATLGLILTFVACQPQQKPNTETTKTDSIVKKKLDSYVKFKLTTDVSKLTEKERQMLPILFQIADIMDTLFWLESYGDQKMLMDSISDPVVRDFARINYGPWDNLDDNKPFVKGYGAKPLTANFYPHDMTKEEFEKFADSTKNSPYSIIKRKADGSLENIPYHVYFKPYIERAAKLLKDAAALAEEAGLKKYLELRSEALLNDNYFDSDMAWMDMKTNTIDFVVGPIESYEDQLYNNKAAHEAYILVKDKQWSDRLAKYAKMLPELQKGLPCPPKYKAETPGSDSDLGAYDVLYYAGDCNSGSKTIAINLPNDEKVQLAKGSRRLQLKNAMQAKFDNILKPISDVLIAPDQRQYITFDAFFATVMFHEVAHGLGIKNTLDGKQTVSAALQETSTVIEEGKADIVGLYMIQKLFEKKELEGDIKDYYVTFLAGIFRSIRFGGASSHGKTNLLRFNYFKEKQAFTQNADGTYSVNFDKMQEAMNSLSELILTIQGDGDYNRAKQLIADKCVIDADLQASLDRISKANIPIDVVFEQGPHVLGLK